MCGLAGFWDPGCARFEPVIFAMTNALRHRGPDGAGYWFDGRHGVALGHRRLSILDLSDSGRQPMFSASGRYALVYNGEVYNFLALRREIERIRGDYPFYGSSDTEVILAAVEVFGLQEALERMVGMFAFALWDREDAKLYLVRDRLGIKPLYYAYMGGAVVFGSELKALRAHRAFEARIDRGALSQFLRYGNVPAPQTIFEGVRKCRPGEMVTITAPREAAMITSRWWRARDEVAESRAYPYRGDADSAVVALETALMEAVGMRMVADVPLGAFLSGGIDSSTVAALMQAQSELPVRTFSIGFENKRYDEADDAEGVARHLGTDHTSLIVEAGDVLSVIPDLATLYDEPFADSSQLPTFLVSRLARQDVTVALSGDGGDELFGGYNRHLWGPRLWAWMRHIPRPLRAVLGRAALTLSPRGWDRLFERMEDSLPRAGRVRMAGDKVHKMAGLFGAGDQEELYGHMLSQWNDPGRVVMGGFDGGYDFADEPDLESLAERWMYRDLVGYLPDDILTKVDRASMGVSLEVRVPMLDHRVVALAWRLSQGVKIHRGIGKWVLRQVLYRHVPQRLVERPKMGFGVPIDSWLRDELHNWAAELLRPEKLQEQGFFHPRPIEKMWKEHQSGRRNWANSLWNVLIFQHWWETSHLRDIEKGGSYAHHEQETTASPIDIGGHHRPPLPAGGFGTSGRK